MSHPIKGPVRIEEVILHYASLIVRDQDPEARLHLSAAMARDLVGADRCSIWLVDLKAQEMFTTIAHGAQQIRVPYGAGIVGACVTQGQPIIVNDPGSDQRFFRTVDKNTGYQTNSVAVVPLRSADGSIMGALQALNKPEGFSGLDVDLLNLVASYAAAMMEGQRLRQEAEATRLLYRELEVAWEVQRQMFPTGLPQLQGFEYAAACRPAKFVGGDYYDWLALPSGNFAFTIGDVSGKGIAAALVMAGIQSFLRGELMGASGEIAGCLGEVNNSVFRSTPPERYSTLFCGVLDRSKRLLTYCNCGHVAPILCREANGKTTVERLNTGGVPVGLLPGVSFAQANVILAPGDVLVCFSDGLSEATNSHGEMWDESVLEEAVLKIRSLDATQIVSHLLASADRFADGAEQSDDITMVVLRSV